MSSIWWASALPQGPAPWDRGASRQGPPRPPQKRPLGEASRLSLKRAWEGEGSGALAGRWGSKTRLPRWILGCSTGGAPSMAFRAGLSKAGVPLRGFSRRRPAACPKTRYVKSTREPAPLPIEGTCDPFPVYHDAPRDSLIRDSETPVPHRSEENFLGVGPEHITPDVPRGFITLYKNVYKGLRCGGLPVCCRLQ